MILFDFRCTECDRVDEHLVRRDTKVVACNECGSPATKLIPAPRCKLEGISGDFPGAAIKWAKDHERAAKQAAKANSDNTF